MILKRPLASSLRDDRIITGNPLGDDAVDLVAQYDYSPRAGDVDGMSYGGRAQAWLGDRVRVGVSGINERVDEDEDDHSVLGADVRVRLGERSYAQAEIAQSRGRGIGGTRSINGGLTNDSDILARGTRANAYGARVALDLAEIGVSPLGGTIEGYWTKREAGFSAIGYETEASERAAGLLIDAPINERIDLRAEVEDYRKGTGERRLEGEIGVITSLGEHWSVGVAGRAVRYDGLAGTVGRPGRESGTRADLGLRIGYAPSEDREYYAWGQATVSRSGELSRNDRIGVGARHAFNDKLAATGELSYGTYGWAALAGFEYDPTPHSRYTIGYRLDADDPYGALGGLGGIGSGGFGDGGLVLSARHRHGDYVTAFSEIGYDRWGSTPSLLTTYGVEIAPAKGWSATGAFEYGTVEDEDGDRLDRRAVSLALGYAKDDAYSWRVKTEGRFEDSDTDALDRDTYLVSAQAMMRVSEDWRLIANADAALSDASSGDFLDGDFVEASIGFAYRPTTNDRLNALFKYAYLYDLPGADQQTAAGTVLGPAQRSHILTADAIYDVNRWLSVGGKYGFRTGEVSQTREAEDFASSTAHLGVVRADVHVVKNWDVFAEARVLSTTELETTRTGFAAGAWRHVGENFKVGVGYNFAEFSDDVADLTVDDAGVFVNVVGKF